MVCQGVLTYSLEVNGKQQNQHICIMKIFYTDLPTLVFFLHVFFSIFPFMLNGRAIEEKPLLPKGLFSCFPRHVVMESLIYNAGL